jgi:hypothetical protein
VVFVLGNGMVSVQERYRMGIGGSVESEIDVDVKALYQD